jgi:hypothetical protein
MTESKPLPCASGKWQQESRAEASKTPSTNAMQYSYSDRVEAVLRGLDATATDSGSSGVHEQPTPF